MGEREAPAVRDGHVAESRALDGAAIGERVDLQHVATVSVMPSLANARFASRTPNVGFAYGRPPCGTSASRAAPTIAVAVSIATSRWNESVRTHVGYRPGAAAP